MKDGRCHVAIIDDGICFSTRNPPLLYYKDFINTTITEEATTHSSIVAQIIKKYNTECVISNIRIIDHRGNGEVGDLIRAIRWCVANHVDVIHLSIGTTHFSDFSAIHAAITKASAKKIIVIASQSNDCLFTIPACLDSVIGVRHSDECKPREFIIQYGNWDGIDIVTSSRFAIITQSGCHKSLNPSNSFASPYITALVARLITCYGSMRKSSILTYLEQDAKRIKGRPVQRCEHRREVSRLNYLDCYNQEQGNHILRVYKTITTPIILINDKKIHEMLFDHFMSAGYNCYPVIIDGAYRPTEQHSLIREKIRCYLSFVDIKYDPDMFVVLSRSDLISCYDVKIAFGEDISITFRGEKSIRLSKNKISEMLHELMQYCTGGSAK